MPSVLVIDDERATLTMFRLFLKAFGYDVHVAEDGDTGIAMFREQTPPLVFTDIKMPGTDGFDVLRAVKNTAPETEVVVITGHGDMDLVLRALHLDATDFINKPVRRSALQTALDRAQHRIRHPESRRCRITVTPAGGGAPTTVAIDGILDASARTDLHDILQSADLADGPGLVIAFAPHASFNGAGLDLFIRLLAECKDRRLPVAICGLCENFRTIMEMIGVPKTLPFTASFADAARALAPAP